MKTFSHISFLIGLLVAYLIFVIITIVCLDNFHERKNIIVHKTPITVENIIRPDSDCKGLVKVKRWQWTRRDCFDDDRDIVTLRDYDGKCLDMIDEIRFIHDVSFMVNNHFCVEIID
jgi:hypothetical protein